MTTHEFHSARPSSSAAPPAHAESVRISRQVLFRSVGDEAVLLDLASSRYFGLDGVGTRIWQLFAEHRRLSEVADRLLVEYDAPAARIEGDLAAFVGELAGRGLLEVDRGP
jgi:hypothetical protein